MKKKKLLNRLLSALLAVIMAIGLIPMGAVTVKAETKNATLSNLGALGTVKIGSKSESGSWYQTEVAGTPVFCLDLGKACHAGDVYESSDATYSSDSKNEKKALEAKIGHWYSVTKKEKVKTIGVAGAVRRMGTTTQALQIVKYLKFNGYKAAYFEMNNHGFVKAVREFYEDSQYDEMEGLTEYQNVDMYYKAERLKEVQDKDYEYIVYDYGVYSEHDFNKVSFLEKDIQIFVVGSKPDEFEKTYDLIKSNFYNDVFYVFNFTSDAEKKDIKELMEDKADKTFFADESKDPFTFGNSKIYSEMIPIEDKSEQKKEKKSGFFRKRKK